MQIQTIPLTSLRAHPANSNAMTDAMLNKLTAHIEQTDRYPPVIVRPAHRDSGDTSEARFQILDGHHRVEALRRLSCDAARCVVWDVDDDKALLLLATLNRLEGKDDPTKRAALLSDLRERFGVERLCASLPEQQDELDALLALRDAPPTPSPPRRTHDLPVAVHFFLNNDDRERLEAALRAGDGSREAVLMSWVVAHAEPQSPRASSP